MPRPVKWEVAHKRAVPHHELGFVAAGFPSEVEMHTDMSVRRMV